jgi:hypothetical protein
VMDKPASRRIGLSKESWYDREIGETGALRRYIVEMRDSDQKPKPVYEEIAAKVMEKWGGFISRETVRSIYLRAKAANPGMST